ncbi:MAG TPA: AAA family ATPase [Solirubrobacteraceae bacterium]|nr:AAA family ATPase [Solirubrobacteraceae bacterium]
MVDKRLSDKHGPELETLTFSDDLAQTCIAGRYEIKGSLGSGASKEVFLAHDIRLGRNVALGRVRSGGSRGALSARVLQEIQTTAQLDEHPHIVTVHDVIQEEDATWIVSQLVRGGSAAGLLEAHPDGLPINEAVRIAAEVADALHFAHEHGVIHRDVKPSNVLLAFPGNSALLADFGVAFLTNQPRLTADGVPVGTAVYMPPEQARGEAADPRSDLYSLGVMLFELISGHPPFSADTFAGLIKQHLFEPPPDPAELNPAPPAWLSRLILQLLSKDPDARPGSALVVARALQGLQAQPGLQVGIDEPRAAPLPAPLVADAGRSFVDRRPALGDLGDAWSRAARGRPHLAVITGEAGIGKTSVAAAFAQSVQADGALVLYGRCDEDPLVSYQPFVGALRQLIAHRPGVVAELEAGWTAELAELARLIPELRRRLAHIPAAQAGGQALERYQLFESMLALLAPAARDQRLLLVLDDFQWADEPTELLLRHLMRAMPSGLMALITRRAPKPRERDPIAKVAEDLARDAGGPRRLVRLSLGGLDAGATYELASARREHPVDREFSQLLQAETAGNPFFIEQVLTGLGEADLSVTGQATAALRSLGVPQEVQEFIEYRLAEFSSDTRTLLRQASVCGPEFRLDVLTELRQARGESVIDLLSEPIAAGLVLEPQIGRYVFSHALVRETLYERGLGKSERARLHLRIGEALERLPPRNVSAAELARHFHAAREVGGADRAVKYGLAAAEQASQALAYEEGAVFAREASIALEFLGPAHDRERCRIVRFAGHLLWQAGNQHGAQEAFFRAAIMARELGDSSEFARAALGYAGRSYHAESVDPLLRRLFTEALATVAENETSLRAKLLARLAEALHPVDPEQAIELTDQALKIVRVAPDEDALTTVLAARHMALINVAHHQERWEVGKSWVELAERQRRSLGTALTWRVYDLIERGDPADVDEARKVRKRLADLGDELQQPWYWHFAASLDAKWLLMEGQFADAENKARQGYAYGTRAQGTHVALLFAGQHFGLLWDQGRLGELPQAVASFLDVEDATLPAWRAASMVAHSAAGDIERARSELHEMVRDDCAAVPYDMFSLGILCLLAEGAAELADTQAARVILGRLEPHARYNAQIGLSIVLGPAHGFLGRLAALLDDRAAARRHFGLALERAEFLGARPAVARIQCHFAEFLLAGGGEHDLVQAHDLLERSGRGARDLGMAGIAGRVARALEGLPVRPGSGAAADAS